MPEPKPLSPAQKKICYIFQSLGAVMLAFGLYMGFVKDSGSVFVFALLGGSVALFAVPLSMLLKLRPYRILDPAKAESKPEAKAESKPKAKPESKPGTKTEPMPEAKAESKPETKAEPMPDANTDAPPLMNTTLSDLLLAALIKDPNERLLALGFVLGRSSKITFEDTFVGTDKEKVAGLVVNSKLLECIKEAKLTDLKAVTSSAQEDNSSEQTR